MDFTRTIEEVKGCTYIIDIPIKRFKDLHELECFVKHAKKNGIGTVLYHESSNFYQGVVVQAYDIKTCECKGYLGSGVK